MSAERAEVWGDPIAHSRSPALHRAAYARLGLDWSYGRRRVKSGDFAAAFAEQRDRLRGLSVTMPLKEEALRAADAADRFAALTGAANTVLIGERIQAFNTDVAGIVAAFGESGVRAARSARILGAGATAASALVALSELGAQRVEVRARRPERAADLLRIGAELGTEVIVRTFEEPASEVSATVATLPSGAVLDDAVAAPLIRTGGALLDVAYAPWPSPLAAAWTGEPVVSGLLMLLHQAVRQVRIFTQADPDLPLPEEDAVVAVMRSALMGD